jgi:hypothetical protein
MAPFQQKGFGFPCSGAFQLVSHVFSQLSWSAQPYYGNTCHSTNTHNLDLELWQAQQFISFPTFLLLTPMREETHSAMLDMIVTVGSCLLHHFSP